MADLEQIEQEFRNYLDLEKNLKKEDRLNLLMSIINKHLAMEKMDHIAKYDDLMDMIGNAKGQFASTRIPMQVSRKEISSQEAVYVLVLEAFVGYLNKNKLLRRLVHFDHDSRR